MKTKLWILVFTLVFGLVATTVSAGVKLITKEDLVRILGQDNVTVIDVRKGRDWTSSEFKIRGAERVDLRRFVSQAKKFPKENTIVLYCA